MHATVRLTALLLYVPGEQALHTLAPVDEATLPLAHAAHAEPPVAPAYVPRAQAVHAEAPPG